MKLLKFKNDDMIWRVIGFALLFVLGSCANSKQVQDTEEEPVIPRLELSEVYFQELVPGQEGATPYYVLAAVLESGEEKKLVSAVVLDDTIELKKQNDRYTGLCPEIYRFEKGEVPEVKIYYMWGSSLSFQTFRATVKEPIYMP